MKPTIATLSVEISALRAEITELRAKLEAPSTPEAPPVSYDGAYQDYMRRLGKRNPNRFDAAAAHAHAARASGAPVRDAATPRTSRFRVLERATDRVVRDGFFGEHTARIFVAQWLQDRELQRYVVSPY